jgi:hypothetical protein
MKRIDQADIIKLSAVVTATPRWVGALMAAEGLNVPDTWLSWWIWLSLFLNAAMAVVEGLAFAYVFNAWRNQKDRASNRLLWFAAISAAVFIIVLAPFIAAQVRDAPMHQVLGDDWLLWLWSAAVAASTITIVASVGYAQKQPRERPAKGGKSEQPQPAITAEMNGRKRSKADFERAITDGTLDLHILTGERLAEWAGVSGSTGRRWLRELETNGRERA